MINDVLYLNGKPVPREKVADYVGNLDGDEGHWTQYRETLPGGKSYVTSGQDHRGPLDNTELFVGAAGPLFHDGRQSRQQR
jgi:signal peptidase I